MYLIAMRLADREYVLLWVTQTLTNYNIESQWHKILFSQIYNEGYIKGLTSVLTHGICFISELLATEYICTFVCLSIHHKNCPDYFSKYSGAILSKHYRNDQYQVWLCLSSAYHQLFLSVMALISIYCVYLTGFWLIDFWLSYSPLIKKALMLNIKVFPANQSPYNTIA